LLYIYFYFVLLFVVHFSDLRTVWHCSELRFFFHSIFSPVVGNFNNLTVRHAAISVFKRAIAIKICASCSPSEMHCHCTEKQQALLCVKKPGGIHVSANEPCISRVQRTMRKTGWVMWLLDCTLINGRSRRVVF